MLANVSPRIPTEFLLAARARQIRLTRFLLSVHVARQRMTWFEFRPNGVNTEWGQANGAGSNAFVCPRSLVTSPGFAIAVRREFVISTARAGIGQAENSFRTPLGLHRVARKVGAGWPIGTVFQSRQPVGLTWRGNPQAPIAHRILWLEGLEPGHNRGGGVDTFARYIYIHGLGDETRLGHPNSKGCIHLAASDLIPLFDQLPEGTLVWIGER